MHYCNYIKASMATNLDNEFLEILKLRENTYNSIQTKELQEKDKYDREKTDAEDILMLEKSKIKGLEDVNPIKEEQNNDDNLSAELQKWNKFIESPANIEQTMVFILSERKRKHHRNH